VILLYENGTALFNEGTDFDEHILRALLKDPRFNSNPITPRGFPDEDHYFDVKDIKREEERLKKGMPREEWHNENGPHDNNRDNGEEEDNRRPRRPPGSRGRPRDFERKKFSRFSCLFIDEDILVLRVELVVDHAKPILMHRCIELSILTTIGLIAFFVVIMYCNMKYKKAYESIRGEERNNIEYYNNSLN